MCLRSSQLDAACPPPPLPCERLAKADLIFVGTVVERVHHAEQTASGAVPRGIDQYRFKVPRPSKGVTPGDFSALFSYNPGSDTDSFAPGRRYLIFAHRRVTGAFIAGCAWSRELRRNEDDSLVVEMRSCVKNAP
jgi:hypothetical protein